ncbi:short chain dehydrogenase [Nakamurella panacisegetis]|uniref:Short chain dehydrogenase n=1 Tax=Nakamurella panacisegetis TaxID=1090615 RepID=A0A1H0IKF6_9ACTN|nr:short chain dehydrogenase [Nakamurella panacisegetis]
MNGLVILVTGATGSAGRATVRALARAGAEVVAVGRDEHRLATLFAGLPGVHCQVAEISDTEHCEALADRVRRRHHRIDGLVHLVGGWRGGSGFTANSDDDWGYLSRTLIDSLRHITMALHDDLAASSDGRAVIVSATAAERPTPGGANYAAAKAATEAWMLAMAESFRRLQSGAKSEPFPQRSAATILIIKALVDQGMRDAAPDKQFTGFTDVRDLADRIVDLFTDEPAEVNGARLLM